MVASGRERHAFVMRRTATFRSERPLPIEQRTSTMATQTQANAGASGQFEPARRSHHKDDRAPLVVDAIGEANGTVAGG